MSVSASVSTEEIRQRAFVAHGPSSPIRLVEEGPLAGLDFAVKDLFNVAGFKTACGNPDRLRDDPPAVAHERAVAGQQV